MRPILLIPSLLLLLFLSSFLFFQSPITSFFNFQFPLPISSRTLPSSLLRPHLPTSLFFLASCSSQQQPVHTSLFGRFRHSLPSTHRRGACTLGQAIRLPLCWYTEKWGLRNKVNGIKMGYEGVKKEGLGMKMELRKRVKDMKEWLKRTGEGWERGSWRKTEEGEHKYLPVLAVRSRSHKTTFRHLYCLIQYYEWHFQCVMYFHTAYCWTWRQKKKTLPQWFNWIDGEDKDAR